RPAAGGDSGGNQGNDGEAGAVSVVFERDGKRVRVTEDPDTGVFNVCEIRGRREEPVGFVFQAVDFDEDTKQRLISDTWSASRHTYSGTPADHAEGFSTMENAALSLYNAQPFRGDEYAYQGEVT